MSAQQATNVASTSTNTSAPEIAIISPTPRTFTFPIECNFPYHTLSPIESPSSSPFEPDLSPLSFVPFPSQLTPPPQLTSEALSPAHRARLQARSHSHSPSRSHSRAGQHILSSTSLPKRGDPDYIKRPENAFILFRRKCCEERHEEEAAIRAGKTKRKPRQADLSKSISQQWKSLSPAERQYWEDLAKEKKKEHEELYPDYVYRPQRARDKDGNVKPRKPRGGHLKGRAEKSAKSASEESSSFLNITLPSLPIGLRPYGRSLSLPSPREMVEFPNVYGDFPMNPARPSAPGHETQGCDESASIDWTAMRGEGVMPWGVNWGVSIQMPELVPTYFPNPDFTFEPGAAPLHFSPSMSSESSQSSLPSLPPFEFSLDAQFPPCAQFGMDIEVDFSTQPLGYASMAWEQSNLAWGPNSMLPVPDQESASSSSHVNNTNLPQWGAGAIPPLELGLPRPSVSEDDVTPTGELDAPLRLA